VVAANGLGVEEFWKTLLEGCSGVGPITLFDASKLPNRIAAEVKNFDPSLHVPGNIKWKRLARHTQFALAALDMALIDAGLADAPVFRRPVCVAIGVSTSAIDVVEVAASGVRQGGRGPAEPLARLGFPTPCRGGNAG
jgi:3-oxoacyl-[acyl-carrier-protein] synthase II